MPSARGWRPGDPPPRIIAHKVVEEDGFGMWTVPALDSASGSAAIQRSRGGRFTVAWWPPGVVGGAAREVDRVEAWEEVVEILKRMWR